MIQGKGLTAMLVACLACGGFLMAEEAANWVGKKAPDVELVAVGADGKESKVKLSSFQGKKNVVLAFYPKAMTPG